MATRPTSRERELKNDIARLEELEQSCEERGAMAAAVKARVRVHLAGRLGRGSAAAGELYEEVVFVVFAKGIALDGVVVDAGERGEVHGVEVGVFLEVERPVDGVEDGG